MAWTVAEAIEETRSLHPAFDPQTTPDSVLRHALNRYHAELYGRLVDQDPHLFATEWELTFPLSDFDAGEDLPADWDTTLGGDVLFKESNRTRRLNFVPWGLRHSPGSRYPATILGGTIYFIGLERDWDLVEKVTIQYVPLPADLAAQDTEADLPDRAKRVCVERVALTAANRATAVAGEKVDLGFTMEEWRESEQQLVQEIGRPAKAETSYIRDVW